ncbi:GNAT family N-acetyltransferase [Ochrobactrum sp. A-1]|uniref:GNAT family N-acetyltransferase n=1 Tax=Ochrobactrum sp. A-1 TaxID=2920940 RepID=UPI001F0AC941|nr:GNAT family N-acetyltransferase [Ochrobactrum sp. A-1]
MNIVWGDSSNPLLRAHLCAFVDKQIGGSGLGFGDSAVAMGVSEDDGRLAGAVVFHNYEPRAGVIEMSAASLSRRWLNRPVLQRMFDYVFDDAGCQMVVMRVSERNAPMIRIARAYGFSEVLIPRLRGRDHNEFIFTLTDDDWKASRFNRKCLSLSH